ncbi:MAG: AAA family ATPase [Bacteroidaceae bacterium]|nr:AAA family ATPase [Bacteroidaceae bacterium]
MRKRFNITGSCNPERHYMVDTEKRFNAVKDLIDAGEYFTINRARQYGKTTTLRMIWRRLSNAYLIIDTSFEGVGDAVFENEATFVQLIVNLMKDALNDKDSRMATPLYDKVPTNMEELSKVIVRFCKSVSRPVLLLIDEVDKSSDNQLFLNFIGMLRQLYLNRDKEGMDSTFHSVILAGVYDIKNLKLKLRPDAEKKYNSPWNIAADFNVDMTFHPEEIAQMLGDYENDVHTGMDIKAISEEIYKYTTGYPFLVSYICKMIDERFNQEWTSGSIVKAVKLLVQGESTLMDDLSKNLENYPEFREFMYSVSINSASYSFSLLNPMVNMGNMFSYIRNKNGHVVIHNLIFEEALFLYFTLDYTIKNSTKLSPFQLNYVRNGQLNMEHVITRFADLMHQEYRKSDEDFLERQGRLVFLSFLKPIINGSGFYYVEPQTRDNRRMDLVVTYGKQEFIVELKIWHGDKYEEKGRDQLSNYLAIRGMDEGYLVTFDFSKDKQDAEPQWIEWNGKRIFEVIV